MRDNSFFIHPETAEEAFPIEDLQDIATALLYANERGSLVSVRAAATSWFLAEIDRSLYEEYGDQPTNWKYVEPMEYINELERLAGQRLC